MGLIKIPGTNYCVVDPYVFQDCLRSYVMPNKNNVDKKISYANGDDNVIPMGPIPHEKPWYETDEGKKLIAKTSKSELIEMLGDLPVR